MYDVLREHAAILRSQADELDNIASVLESQMSAMTVPRMRDTNSDYEPIRQPPVIDPDRSASDVSIAVPDGQVHSTYNIRSDLNFEATVTMARHEARQGKIVRLHYEDDPSKDCILHSLNFDRVVPRP